MSKLRLLFGSVLMLSCGCAGMSNSEKGFIGGGLLGAGVGTLAGIALHNPAAGAAIGGVAGAGIGGIAGAVKDNREEKKQEARQAQAIQAAQAQAAAKRMNMWDVIAMVQQHISDEVIIGQIRSTNSWFDLKAGDIIALKQNGVSDHVVQEMQSRHFQPLYTTPMVVQPAPIYYPSTTTVIYEEPRPVVGVGIGYRYYGGCRHW